ncbi:tRNA (adenine(58)-N(1))-methyltransferase non-catalytic subunit TRM6 [Periophthalmus magnuspinnatus]|uniref:tRNA (adenine(58)-N(1))-methyltransferase non-catalytic subunit TRM6 n=1 Tax=Periophthalmus magnuspinnatus TaxID=409849 RepID=UPI00145B09B5|nr:tRNA (adenine(58)-N(1))-methyltransferase non-catalytic subunit TRM6 [Periophthalmus magnuspinnatus]
MADNGDDDSQYRMKEGDYVVLKRGDIFKAAQIVAKKKVIFEKQWFFLDNAVGHLYNSTFEIHSGQLQLKKTSDTGGSADSKEAAGVDNRNIVDDGKSQKLTRDDIEMLKEKGLKGQEIIQQLIDNSSTFKDKTEYAQDKYIKKKKKKYENSVTLLKPSCRILAMMYHGREPGKICHLRYDTLAQMLTLANIHAGSKVVVFETCAGLVLGAVMERMGGFGSVVQMYPGGGPVRAGVDSFGFPAHFHHTLHEFPLCRVNALLNGTLEAAGKDPGADEQAANAEEEQRKPAAEQQGSPEELSVETRAADTESLEPEEPEEPEEREKERRKEAKEQEKKQRLDEKRKKLSAAAAVLEGRNADGLVIASRFHPCPVLMGLLPLLAPSRPFVVYSQYKEPLVECYSKLKEQGGTVNLQLTNTWLRHYQVLPNRTHPVLLMSGGGGYLLSGTTVASGPSKPGQSKPVQTNPAQFKPAESQSKEEPAAKRLKTMDTDG